MSSANKQWSRFVLRLNRRHPFFACVALFATFTPDESIEIAETSGTTIRTNPRFLDSLGTEERFSYLLHQVLHLSLQHERRGANRRPDVWNAAADIVVNHVIASSTRWPAAPRTVSDTRFADASVEHVYAVLMEERPPSGPDENGEPPDRDLTDTSSVEGTVAEDDADGRDDRVARKSTPRSSKRDRERAPHSDLVPPSGSTSVSAFSETERHWRAALTRGRDVAAGREASELPAGLRREFERIDKGSVDWRAALWRFVADRRSDYTEFDLRHIHAGRYIEELHTDGIHLAVAIDTSSSIGVRALGRFMDELDAIRRAWHDVRLELYYCDAEVDGPYTLESRRSGTPMPVGGGGTSFAPFFDALAEASPAERPGAAIYFTDGFGAFPDSRPGLPVLWALTESGLPEGHVPFGRTIVLEDTGAEPDLVSLLLG